MPLHLEKTVAGISSSNCLQPSLSEKGESGNKSLLRANGANFFQPRENASGHSMFGGNIRSAEFLITNGNPKNIEVRGVERWEGMLLCITTSCNPQHKKRAQ